MKLINSLKQKKSVHSVIAVILIIGLVISAGGKVYVLTITLLDDSTARLTVLDESYSDIDGNGMVDKIRFIIKNLGTEAEEITGIEVFANDIQLTTWTITENGGILEQNAELSFTFQTVNVADQLTSNDENSITLITKRGDRVFIQLEVPESFATKVIGEAGVVAVGGTEVNVTLQNTYVDPVVVVTGVANDTSTVRSGTNAAQWPTITGVGKNWFTIKQTTDSSDNDGVTVTNVNYIVMEVGVHYLRNIQIVVGKATVTGQYSNVTFAKNFTALPIVIASPQTNNMETNNGGARTRFNGLGGSYVTMQLEEGGNSNPGASYVETVGYIAIEAGNDPFSQIQALITADAYKHTWKAIGFDPLYLSPPIVLAHLFGEDGSDACYTTVADITTAGFSASTEEPPSRDGPHTNEKISFVAIPAGIILGTTTS